MMAIDTVFSIHRSRDQLVRRLAPIAVVVAAVILNPLRVIPEDTTCAKLRLGQVQNQPVMPGLNVLIPFVDSLDCMNVSAIGNRTKLKADWESTIKANLRPYPVEVIGLDVVNLAPSQKVAEAIEIKQVAEQEALAATYKANAKKNEALGVIEEARGQAEANRLKAESLRVPGAREVTELEKFRLWAQNGSKVPTTLILGGEGGFWLSKMLGIR
jgi:regulator of protease activity HflC (stomatin/prohibitin superfamily)